MLAILDIPIKIILGGWITNYLGLSTRSVTYRSLWIALVSVSLIQLGEWMSALHYGTLTTMLKSVWQGTIFYPSIYLGICGTIFGTSFKILRDEFSDKFKTLDERLEKLVQLDLPRYRVFNESDSSDIADHCHIRYFNFAHDAILFKLDRHQSFLDAVELAFFAFELAKRKNEACEFDKRYKEINAAFLRARKNADFNDRYQIWYESVIKMVSYNQERSNERLRELFSSIKLAIEEISMNIPEPIRSNVQLHTAKIDPQIADVIEIRGSKKAA